MSGIIGYQSISGKSGILGRLPFFVARGSNATGAISQSGYEFINYSWVDQGGGSSFTNSTGRFTAPITGNYFFTLDCMAVGGQPSNVVVRAFIRKNNAANDGSTDGAIQIRIDDGDAGAAEYETGHASVIFQLDAGEYVSAYTSTGYIYGGDSNYFAFTGRYLP